MAYNSTIIPKQKPCKSCGRMCYPFSSGRCIQCARVESFHARTAKIVSDDLGDLIKDADAITSRYVRLKYSVEGVIKCFTCGKEMNYHDAQCGHFIGRSNMYLRFDLRNLRPQCNACNCYKHGNINKFRENLNKEHHGLADILMEESYLIHHISQDEIRGIIADYTQRIKQLTH